MNWHIGSSTLLFLSMITMVFLFVQYGNGAYIPIQSDSNYPEELFDECVGVAGKSFCDFLFKKSAVNRTNLTASMPSNYTESTNSMSGSWNASSPPINSPLNSSYLTYDDNDHGFSIEHPSDWFPGYHDTERGTVIAFSPVGGEKASVDVKVFPKGDYASIKEFGNTFKESDEFNLLAYYRNGTTKLGGKPAFRAVYLVDTLPTFAESLQGFKSEPAKALYIGTMVPEKKSIYSIAYFADPQVFDKYLPVVEKMIDSFEINAKGPVIQEDNSSSISPD